MKKLEIWGRPIRRFENFVGTFTLREEEAKLFERGLKSFVFASGSAFVCG